MDTFHGKKERKKEMNTRRWDMEKDLCPAYFTFGIFLYIREAQKFFFCYATICYHIKIVSRDVARGPTLYYNDVIVILNKKL